MSERPEQREGESLHDFIMRKRAWADARPTLMKEDQDWLHEKTDTTMIAAAVNRAYQLYNGTGDVEGALTFIGCLCHVRPSDEAIEWGRRAAEAIVAGKPPVD